jgi:hypothetical protein
VTVYVSEAHPDDEWQMESNREDGVVIKQPRAFEERKAAARILVERFDYDLPLVLDAMDNRAEALYAAWPERLFVVAAGGRLVYCGGLGPFGFDLEEMEQGLAAHRASARASAR